MRAEPGPRARHSTLTERFDSPGPKRILSLDGGGIRGAISIGYLQRVETILRDRHQDPTLVLSDYFDLIVGTSTGAIIASLLATGLDTDEVASLYADLGQQIFTRRRGVSGRLASRFDAEPLETALRDALGEHTLGTGLPDVRTGLCIVVKRADTQSTWPLMNHPGGVFFDKNRHIPLWQAVRASTAAPTYFQPHLIELGDEIGAFVDGGVSMANNPALVALQVASLSGFPFHWDTGEHNLLLLSIGTGDWAKSVPIERVMDARIWNWATQIPTMLLGDASKQVEFILQWIGHSPTARLLNQEIGDLSRDGLDPAAALTYLRYNVVLDSDSMRTIGLDQLAASVDQLRDMSDADNRHALLDVGRAAAKLEVVADHFPASFDLRD